MRAAAATRNTDFCMGQNPGSLPALEMREGSRLPAQPRAFCVATRQDGSACPSVQAVGTCCSFHAATTLAVLALCGLQAGVAEAGFDA